MQKSIWIKPPLTSMEYVPGSDSLDEESCEFEEEGGVIRDGF